MTDKISEYIENTFEIRGIFKREIHERFQIVIDLLEIVGFEKENIKKSNFGIHYCSLVLDDIEKIKTFRGMLKEYEEDGYIQETKQKNNRLIIYLPEPEYIQILIYETKRVTLPKKTTFDELLNFINIERNKFPQAVNVSCGTTYLTFKTPTRRLEDEKEYKTRLADEDRTYIEKYKNISKQLAEMDKLKEYM